MWQYNRWSDEGSRRRSHWNRPLLNYWNRHTEEGIAQDVCQCKLWSYDRMRCWQLANDGDDGWMIRRGMIGGCCSIRSGCMANDEQNDNIHRNRRNEARYLSGRGNLRRPKGDNMCCRKGGDHRCWEYRQWIERMIEEENIDDCKSGTCRRWLGCGKARRRRGW